MTHPNKQRREALGLNTTALAARIGCAARTLELWESNATKSPLPYYHRRWMAVLTKLEAAKEKPA